MTPCHICGREVAMRFKVNRAHNGGKARMRHRCPHGQWCEAGDRLNGLHANNPRIGGCPECWKRVHRLEAERRAARAEAK